MYVNVCPKLLFARSFDSQSRFTDAHSAYLIRAREYDALRPSAASLTSTFLRMRCTGHGTISATHGMPMGGGVRAGGGSGGRPDGVGADSSMRRAIDQCCPACSRSGAFLNAEGHKPLMIPIGNILLISWPVLP